MARSSKKTPKKKEKKKNDQIAKLKKIGGKVLVNEKFKFKDPEKDPLSLTIKKILLDQI